MSTEQKTAFQSHYETVVGSATLDRTSIVAGSTTDLVLTYCVGKHGIDETGMIKVLSRIASDLGPAQFNDPQGRHYVQVTSSNPAVKFTLSNSMSQKMGKQDVRPWSRGFCILLSKNHLDEGDEVFIQFSNYTWQTYTEPHFEFRLHIDPFATGKTITMAQSPWLSIVPGEPDRLQVILPGKTEPGKPFRAFAKLEDTFGNVCTQTEGVVQLSTSDQQASHSSSLQLSAGKGEVDITFLEEGHYTIQGTFGDLQAQSNPSACTTQDIPLYLWADLQGQSEETVGTNPIEDYFAFAKEYGRLDIVSHQGNDFQITNAFWDQINTLTKAYNQDGRFITFPGYEWSGNSSVGGDHNILFLKEGESIHRSSHALVDDLSDVETDATTIVELCEKVNREETILLAHAGGRHANLSQHAPHTATDLIEIHSDWGTFEWLLKEAFDLKMRVGVTANSDGHKGTPGGSYPGSLHFGSQGGLTCVRTSTFTREGVFKALQSRHTYGTTGARILLDVSCLDASGAILATAGDVLKTSNQPITFNVRTHTTAPLERIEIYQKEKLLQTAYPSHNPQKPGKMVKILYSGASGKGRARALKWRGDVTVSGNAINTIETINIYSESDSIIQTDNTLTITGTTTGSSQGAIVHLAHQTGSLQITLNEQTVEIDLESLSHEPVIYDFGELDAKLEVHTSAHSTDPQTGNGTIVIPSVPESETPFYAKVIQRDGHMAWSSPIYISRS